MYQYYVEDKFLKKESLDYKLFPPDTHTHTLKKMKAICLQVAKYTYVEAKIYIWVWPFATRKASKIMTCGLDKMFWYLQG